jgi:hypothetical protein
MSHSLPADPWLRREPILVVALAVLLFVANLLTVDLYPGFYDDDVLLGDAGVNLYLGHGFTSSAWPGQGKEEFFAGNLPLYPLLLCGWMDGFGFSQHSMRAFSYLCGSLALVTLWWAVRRRGCLRSPWRRLACVAITFLSAPLFLAYRRNRYDGLQLLLCTLLVAIWASSWRPRWKLAALFVTAGLLAASGFQAAAYVGLVTIAVVVWERWSSWRSAVATIAGLGFGAGAVLALYWWHGVLHGLAATVAWGRSIDGDTAAQIWEARKARLILDSLHDPGLLLLLLALLVPFTQRAVRQDRGLRRLAGFAVALTLVIMLGLEAAIHFAPYYRWMSLLPLALLTFRFWEQAFPKLTRPRRIIGAFALAAVGVSGWPALMALSTLLMPYGAQQHRVEAMVHEHVHPGDVVFSDYYPYCAVKHAATQAYFPGYLGRLSPEEEAAINVLVVREAHVNFWYRIQFGEFLAHFTRDGRHWEKVASAPLVRTPVSAWLARYLPERVARYEFNSAIYDLSVFRRVPEPPAATAEIKRP